MNGGGGSLGGIDFRVEFPVPSSLWILRRLKYLLAAG